MFNDYLQSLNCYPVKSASGISLRDAALTPRGLRFDRSWAIIDPSGEVVTQRQCPRLAGLEVSVGASLDLRLGEERLELPLEIDGPEISVTVFGQPCPAVQVDDGGWLAERFSAPYRLAGMPEGTARPKLLPSGAASDVPLALTDGNPLHLITEASLAHLNGYLETPVGTERFRSNLVVEGNTPYAEDGWRVVKLGDVILDVLEPCVRCMMVNVDQRSGAYSKETLATLARLRRSPAGVTLGVHLAPRGPGTLHVGDRLEVLA